MTRRRNSPHPTNSILQGGDSMKNFPPVSLIKRVLFTPINEKRLASTRERVQNDMNSMNFLNIR